jgi:uncharacterized membrane protein YkvA (DUF1232 family)
MTDNSSPHHWLERPSEEGVFQELIRRIKLFWRLLKDRRVPVWVKAIPLISLVYLAVPADVVPDIFVGLGQLDDLAVLALGYRLFIGLAPPDVVREHLNDLIASAARWKVVDGDPDQGGDAVASGAQWMIIDGEAEPVDDAES